MSIALPATHPLPAPSDVQTDIKELLDADLKFHSELSLGSATQIDSIKLMRESLSALGTIVCVSCNFWTPIWNMLVVKATFTAAVQSQVITYSVQDKSGSGAVPNALFFVGLVLDILCGCIAYVEASRLRLFYDLLLRRSASVSAIVASLERLNNINHLHHPPSETQAAHVLLSLSLSIQTREMIFLSDLGNRSRSHDAYHEMRAYQARVNYIIRRLYGEALYPRIAIHDSEYRATTGLLHQVRFRLTDALAASAILPVISSIGVACLIAGTLCFVKISSFDHFVWVPLYVITGTVLAVFLAMYGQRFRAIGGSARHDVGHAGQGPLSGKAESIL